jgi:hypothetical protein
MTEKICAWHECNKPFTPEDGRQKFCCSECRVERGKWKAKRGGPLVDMLIAGDIDGILNINRRIKREIENAKRFT